MALFKVSGAVVRRVEARTIDLERSLQRIFEENLEQILEIQFIAHEFATSAGGRIDTLGLDRDGAPCVIEYKRGRNDNVINQGLSYLKWLVDHKESFEKLCEQRRVTRKVSWAMPRVICVAESFNKFDLDTADFLPINIELYRYRVYDGDLLAVESENYKKEWQFDKRPKAKKAHNELEPYSIDAHLQKCTSSTRELYMSLREKILEIDEAIIEVPKQTYIAYKLARNFADVIVYKNELRITLNVKSGNLTDPTGVAIDFTRPKKGHWGNGDYEVRVRNASELEVAMQMVIQSYNQNK